MKSTTDIFLTWQTPVQKKQTKEMKKGKERSTPSQDTKNVILSQKSTGEQQGCMQTKPSVFQNAGTDFQSSKMLLQ